MTVRGSYFQTFRLNCSKVEGIDFVDFGEGFGLGSIFVWKGLDLGTKNQINDDELDQGRSYQTGACLLTETYYFGELFITLKMTRG